jgi:hypothetical protein
MKKRYLEPFKRHQSPFFYFMIDTPLGRVNLSRKETSKSRARIAIRAYVDERNATTIGAQG